MDLGGAVRRPTHVLAHLSDPHLLADGTRLHGRIDTAAQLRAALRRVEQAGEPVDAIVVSGDLTDTADPAAYRLLREILEPVADRLGAAIVWTGGNHDERRPLAAALHGRDTDEPQDTVTRVRGLRIVTVDTALPGRHDGGLSEDQFAWLAAELATPAPHGTILVLHHPPIAYRSPWMQLLDFQHPDRLRDVLSGSGVRAILSGHLHVPSFGTLGGVPVFIAGGVSYADDAAAPRERLMATDGAQSWNLIEVHEDQVVGTVVPVAQHDTWPALSDHVAGYMQSVPPAERRDVFARKHPTPPPSRREPRSTMSPEATPATAQTAISADGTTIAYEAYGRGPAVLLVGGAFCDRGSSRELAQALAERAFTGVTYDRRGRGDSTDTGPYAVEREVEDLQAVLDAVAHAPDSGPESEVYAHGVSSGGALVLAALAAGLPIARASALEVPYRTAGSPPAPPDYIGTLERLEQAADREGILRYFHTEVVGLPEEALAPMVGLPMWDALLALAPTVRYDGLCLGGDDQSLPVDRLSRITTPFLAVASSGTGAPWLHDAPAALAGALPNGQHVELEGDFHEVPAQTLAAVLADFYRA